MADSVAARAGDLLRGAEPVVRRALSLLSEAARPVAERIATRAGVTPEAVLAVGAGLGCLTAVGLAVRPAAAAARARPRLDSTRRTTSQRSAPPPPPARPLQASSMLSGALGHAPGGLDVEVLLWPQLFPGGSLDSAADRGRLAAALQALPPGSAPALACQRALRKLVDAAAHAKGDLPLGVLLGCVRSAARPDASPPSPGCRPPAAASCTYSPPLPDPCSPPRVAPPCAPVTLVPADAPPSPLMTCPHRSRRIAGLTRPWRCRRPPTHSRGSRATWRAAAAACASAW